MARVDLKKVVKRFGKVEVVHGIDLEINDVEFVGPGFRRLEVDVGDCREGNVGVRIPRANVPCRNGAGSNDDCFHVCQTSVLS